MSTTIDAEIGGHQLVQAPVMQPLASLERQQVCAALAIAQGQFPAPKRTKTAKVQGQTRTGGNYDYTYTYAPLDEIINCVKDPLAANGLGRQQYLVSKGAQAFIRTIIWHASGEWIASDYPIFPTKDGAQGFAAGVTYARRCGLSLILGLAPEDDDDGNIADSNVAQTTSRQPKTKPRSEPMRQADPEPPEDYGEEERPEPPRTSRTHKPTTREWLIAVKAQTDLPMTQTDIHEFKSRVDVQQAQKALTGAAKAELDAILQSLDDRAKELRGQEAEEPDFIEAED